jgi:hypothetical protein
MYLQRNIEASSCNHCCSGQAIYIAYSECVSVDLVVQHALHLRHIVIYGLFGLNPFPHYPIKGTIFEKKKVIEPKMCVLIVSTILAETFLILKRTELDMIKMCNGLYVKYPLFLPDFNETWIFSTDFRKILKFHENVSFWSRDVPDGR